MRLRELLDINVLQKLTEANYKASGMPIGLIDATDGSALVSHGWQEICVLFHRVNPVTLQRCRESDRHIQDHLSDLAERALARLRVEETLREADRRKTEFLAALSHELRNPLAPIQNSLYLLERAGPLGDRGRRALAVANRQLRHLTTIVDDLLDVMRLSRGKLRLDRRRVDLSRLVREAVEDHESSFVDRGVELSLEAADESIWVDGDAMRLSQVVGNLLRNACKFTDAGGHALVRVVRRERDAVIHLRDDGVGIAPELMNVIFEPFVQAEKTLARARGGLGLGLSLVKDLVLAHAGTVTARSDGEGKGAEFVVTLPLAPAETSGRA